MSNLAKYILAGTMLAIAVALDTWSRVSHLDPVPLAVKILLFFSYAIAYAALLSAVYEDGYSKGFQAGVADQRDEFAKIQHRESP